MWAMIMLSLCFSQIPEKKYLAEQIAKRINFDMLQLPIDLELLNKKKEEAHIGKKIKNIQKSMKKLKKYRINRQTLQEYQNLNQQLKLLKYQKIQIHFLIKQSKNYQPWQYLNGELTKELFIKIFILSQPIISEKERKSILYNNSLM